jgi:hypothetical protein
VRIKFYFDDDSDDRRVMRALRGRGIDVLGPLEAGLASAEDSVHLAFARRERRVLVSGNVRDFPRLHAAALTAGDPHCGIVLIIRRSRSIGERVRGLEALWDMRTADDMVGVMLYLPPS